MSYKKGIKVNAHNINTDIKSKQVRLVGDNVEQGIYDTFIANKMAKDMGLDLVEINGNTETPICKIIEYSKFLYELKKKEKEKNKNKTVVKDIRFGVHCDEHDLAFKVKNSAKMLQDGNKVKAYVQFKGREIAYKEQGTMLLLKFATMLENYGKAEYLPKLEGKRMHVTIIPIKK